MNIYILCTPVKPPAQSRNVSITPKVSLCPFVIHLPGPHSTPPFANHAFCHNRSFTFLEHIYTYLYIFVYLFLGVWFFSVSIIILRFIHVLQLSIKLCFLLVSIFYGYSTNHLFIHLLMDTCI